VLPLARTLLDATIPGGPVGRSPAVGWKAASNGTKWTYLDHHPTPAGGIAKVIVQEVPSTPGRVKLRVKGKNASLPRARTIRRSRSPSSSIRPQP
jgi:hypothetical protein